MTGRRPSSQVPVQEAGFAEQRAVERRRRRRILLPVAVIGVMLAALVAILAYEYRTMRDDVLALSEGVIENLQHRIETEVGAYLEPIPGIIRLSRDLLGDALADGIDVRRAEAIGLAALANAPQLNALFAGTPDGEFLMVRRALDDGGATAVETKIIRRAPAVTGGFRNRVVSRDGDGRVTADDSGPWDGYDARTRPWYRGAIADAGLHWTGVYPFFTGNTAGVTVSLPVQGEDAAPVAVIGADVTLASLSRFLAGLTVGQSGKAMIVNGDGQLLAHPDTSLLRTDAAGDPRLAAMTDLDDPVAERAYDRFRVEGHGRRDFERDGRRYITSVSSLRAQVQRDWSVLVVVPESDFVGFVVTNVSRTLVMGLAVILLAALLAGLLIRQGLRTDREALQVLEREAQLGAEAEVLRRLAALSPPGSPDAVTTLLHPVTESLVAAVRVQRAAVWRLDDGGDLLCLDCYDRDADGHTQGMRLERSRQADLLGRIDRAEAIALVDVSADPGLAGFHRHYLQAFGGQALLAAPLVDGERPLGVVWLEDGPQRHAWAGHSQAFLGAVASLLVVRLGGLPGGASARSVATVDERPPGTGAGDASDHGSDTALEERRLAAFTGHPDGGGPASSAVVFDRLAVLALQVDDPAVLAEPAGRDVAGLALDSLLTGLRAAAHEHGIAHLEFFGGQVIAALDAGDDAGLAALVRFALDARGICTQVLARRHAQVALRIGLDVGPAVGGELDDGRDTFAFWGDAVQTAMRMADTAPPGSIQVTEPVYRPLRDAYLFQVRGHHYVAGVGEFVTYLLSDVR